MRWLQSNLFLKDCSVIGKLLFDTVTDACGGYLHNVYSVMADTTAVNTRRASGVNKRLQNYIKNNMGHGIQELECMFHINEVYLTHVIAAIEGKKKGPGAMQGDALLNKLKNTEKPSIANLTATKQFQVPVTKIAALHLKGKLEWFS